MTGHLNVPALEPDPNTPATLSHNILTDLLRKQLGFQGLVVTDAMDMGGITVRYAPGDAAVRAFLAGVDALLRSEEHTSELQSPMYLVCRLLLEKKNKKSKTCVI